MLLTLVRIFVSIGSDELSVSFQSNDYILYSGRVFIGQHNLWGRKNMKACSHHLCGKENRIWLQTKDSYSSVEKHVYCTSCGVIQNISDDRPKAVGYWMNKLGLISFEIGLSQCQKRLIAKEIENNEYFHDTFGSFGSSQKELFMKIVSSYCDVSSLDFESELQLKQ